MNVPIRGEPHGQVTILSLVVHEVLIVLVSIIDCTFGNIHISRTFEQDRTPKIRQWGVDLEEAAQLLTLLYQIAPGSHI